MKDKIINRIMLLFRTLFYKFKCLNTTQPIFNKSKVFIDIIIPVLEKDLKTLPLCIEGIKNNCVNPVKNIYLISPNNCLIECYAKKNNFKYIIENTVLGYTSKDINFILSNGVNRSGWIFQQLLKLSGKIGTERFFVVIDADHILLKPHLFITNSLKTIFYQSEEFHLQYYRTIQTLFGHFQYSKLSYVAHKMAFDKQELKSLHEYIEKQNGKSWDQAIIHCLNNNDQSPFSEFETYGYFYPPKNKILLPWRQKTLKESHKDSYDTLKTLYGMKYWSVTYPAYLQK